jgi:hypothetical protein
MLSYLLIGLFGTCFGAAIVWFLLPETKKTVVHVSVPGSGEHYSVRVETASKQYILDVFSSSGELIRTAGALRPGSVARAAVLPPGLATNLGALSPFDRFELMANGEFQSSVKEEGYQVFPFEI